MQYTTLREPPRPKRPPAPKAPKTPQASRRCPSGFRWDSKKGKCVQAGVGPEYRP